MLNTSPNPETNAGRSGTASASLQPQAEPALPLGDLIAPRIKMDAETECEPQAPAVQAARPRVSVVVPAYNEERRLGPALAEICAYFGARGEPYEVIVVDDGSTDGTAGLVMRFAEEQSEVRLHSVMPNRGKGNAVREGMRQARGELLLFADADGATPIAEFDRLEAAIRRGKDMAIGSRAIQAEDTRVDTVWWRKLPGRFFNFCVNTLLVPDVADTQCGFKLFTADAARFLFAHQTAERFSFDVELLFLARRAGVSMEEVPVNWTNIPGSSVHVVRDGLRMLWDVIKFRFRHRDVGPGSFQHGGGGATCPAPD